MAYYSIKDIEQLTGIRSHTLRIWERRYEVSAAKRTDTNIRVYDEENLKYFLQASLLLNSGIKISKIVQMTEEERLAKIHTISQPQHVNLQDFYINQLILAMIEMDEILFHKTVQASFEEQGVENTMFHVIFPFLDRVGLMWLLNTVNPAQEHFISNLIRQKIVSAIDILPCAPIQSEQKFLLFLPEEELHEITLLFLNYMLRSRGYSTLYLGQNMPLSDVQEALKSYRATYIFSIITAYSPKQLADLFEKMAGFPEQYKLVMAGRAILEMNPHEYPRFTFLYGGKAVIDWLHETFSEEMENG
ncbi:MAG: MerR family transcriptional regulator [Bacteroidia bacterium]